MQLYVIDMLPYKTSTPLYLVAGAVKHLENYSSWNFVHYKIM